MSVYTSVEPEQLTQFLDQYDLGEATEFVGIANGIENTNYFLTTDKGRYVLTLFERDSRSDLRFFLSLVNFLADNGLPCPKALLNREGEYLNQVNGKDAAIVQRLTGIAPVHPSAEQCQAIGDALGQIHALGAGFKGLRADGRGPDWRKHIAAEVINKLDKPDAELLATEVQLHDTNQPSLPRGTIHADLFRDNSLFLGNRLTGLIDFYLSCQGDLLYDLAICMNDWCIADDGSLKTDLATAMLAAYHLRRKLTREEEAFWPLMLRRAALRFWLSRLHDLHFPRDGEMTHTKDPHQIRQLLLMRIQHPETVPEYWPRTTGD